MVDGNVDEDSDQTGEGGHSPTLLSQMTDASQDFETAQNFGNFLVEATQELPASPLAKKRDADSATTYTDRTNGGTPCKHNHTAASSPNPKPKQLQPTAQPQNNLALKKLLYLPLPPGLGTASITTASSKALKMVYKSRPESNPMALNY